MSVKQQVVTACALVWRDNKGVIEVFLPKRAKTKKFLPDVFELPGGHVEFGEEPVDALRREFDEELHVGVEVQDPFGVFSYVEGDEQTVEIIYFAQFVEPESAIWLNAEDHSEYKWFTLETLPEVYCESKPEDDDEYTLVRRGFELLSQQRLGHL